MPLTPEQIIYDLTSLSYPRLSPDGQTALYVTGQTRKDDGKAVGALHRLDIGSGESTTLLGDVRGVSDPLWFADGKRIAYVRRDDDGFAICVADADNVHPRELTTHTVRPHSLALSPDQSTIAYVVPVDPENPDDEVREPLAVPPVKITRRIDYKQDSRGYLNDVREQIMLLNVANGDRRQISTELIDHQYPAWSPDGHHVAVKSSRLNGFRTMLHILDTRDGSHTDLGWEGGAVGTWAWLRDGSGLLLSGDPNASPQHDYWLASLDGGVRQITRDTPFAPDSGYPTISGPTQPVWLDDATALLTGTYQGDTGIWTLNIEAETLDTLTLHRAAQTGLSVNTDRTHALQVRSSSDAVGELALVDLRSGETTVLVNANAELFADHPPLPAEKITVHRNGFDVDAWVTRPADFDPSRTYPLVLNIHGGPHGHHGWLWNATDQLLANAGFIAVSPNPRGSGSYGRAGTESVHGDWGGEDWQDILAVLDHLCEESWVDANRLGISGYSYGGYMASWAIGQTDRFRTAMVGAPVFDLFSMRGTSDIGHGWGEDQWGGSARNESVRKFMHERSPSTHIHNATTPTLIMHGEADDRCPIGQGEMLFVELLKNGVETEFVRFPDCAHLMMRSGPASYRLTYHEKLVCWFETHLTGQSRTSNPT